MLPIPSLACLFYFYTIPISWLVSSLFTPSLYPGLSLLFLHHPYILACLFSFYTIPISWLVSSLFTPSPGLSLLFLHHPYMLLLLVYTSSKSCSIILSLNSILPTCLHDPKTCTLCPFSISIRKHLDLYLRRMIMVSYLDVGITGHFCTTFFDKRD